jgi:hypothetical protein
MYIEGKLLNYTSVAEAYHRVLIAPASPLSLEEHSQLVARMLGALDTDEQREVYADSLAYAPGATQRRRILELIRRAGDVVPPLGVRSGELAHVLASARNYIVHLPTDEPRFLRGTSLAEALELLVMTLQANLLLDLGLSAEIAKELMAASYSQAVVWGQLHRRGCAWR